MGPPSQTRAGRSETPFQSWWCEISMSKKDDLAVWCGLVKGPEVTAGMARARVRISPGNWGAWRLPSRAVMRDDGCDGTKLAVLRCGKAAAVGEGWVGRERVDGGGPRRPSQGSLARPFCPFCHLSISSLFLKVSLFPFFCLISGCLSLTVRVTLRIPSVSIHLLLYVSNILLCFPTALPASWQNYLLSTVIYLVGPHSPAH